LSEGNGRKRAQAEALEQALLEGEGKGSLEAWLAYLLPREALEDFARRFALKIKGFRVEKAPDRILLSALSKAFLEKGEVREAVLERIGEPAESAPEPSPSPPPGKEEKRDQDEDEVRELRSRLEALQVEWNVLELKEKELQGELKKARSGEKKFRRRALEAEEGKRKLEEQVRKLKNLAPEAKQAKDLRREVQSLKEENERLRASLASLNTDRVNLEREVEELRLKKRGKKAPREPKKEPPPVLPGEDPDQWHIPLFEKEFQETLLSAPAPEAQRILKTVFFACQDPAYPSLKLKKLEGKGDLWSVRVDPGMRLIFLREGKVFRFLTATDREDQDTELKSLRERYG